MNTSRLLFFVTEHKFNITFILLYNQQKLRQHSKRCRFFKWKMGGFVNYQLLTKYQFLIKA